VYIVSDKRMYRLSADRTGRPHIDREMSYHNSEIPKPSQVDAGSGTTPTIPPGGLVAITDNANPMDAVLYRTATRLRHHQHRVVCQVPVFAKSASASENSLIGSGRSLSVENNYAYQDPFGPHTGAITRPGFARMDINKHVNGCGLMWTNHTESAPQRGYQSSPRQPRLDRALGASASGAKQSRHRRRDASQAWPLPDKGSHACASALETRATAKAGLDHPFASVALVANLETVTANARLCNRPLPPAVASALHPATRSHVGTLEMSPIRSRAERRRENGSDRAGRRLRTLTIWARAGARRPGRFRGSAKRIHANAQVRRRACRLSGAT
jgi:hypothetical protein